MGERLPYKQEVTDSNPVLVMPGIIQFFICITFRFNNLNKVVKSFGVNIMFNHYLSNGDHLVCDSRACVVKHSIHIGTVL